MYRTSLAALIIALGAAPAAAQRLTTPNYIGRLLETRQDSLILEKAKDTLAVAAKVAAFGGCSWNLVQVRPSR